MDDSVQSTASPPTDDDRALVAEHCWLWLPQSGGRCWLIPDGEGWGAYPLDADLKLRHHPRAPVRGEKAVQDGCMRAYRRFAEIVDEQNASGVELPLPERLRDTITNSGRWQRNRCSSSLAGIVIMRRSFQLPRKDVFLTIWR